MRLFLFDVDGVLVHSRAYHVGVQKTVAYFAQRLGVGDHAPTQYEIDEFEAAMVTVEWESCAIATARMLLDRLRLRPAPRPMPATFWELAAWLEAHPVAIPRPDFGALARACAATLPGQRPSLAMLERFLEEAEAGSFDPAVRQVLGELLGHCYDIHISPSMQVVQTFAVGSETYRRSYGLEPRFKAESLLTTADRPFLNPATRDGLIRAWQAQQLGLSLYTARPSLPPIEARDLPLGYTPEAEAALELVGLQGIPIMAVGRLHYVAHRNGLSVANLVKPSRVQALAAMGAAMTGREDESIEAAIRVDAGGPVTGPLSSIAGAQVHVFEDSAGGLRAATRSVELLNEHGLGLTLTRHGVAPEGSPKVKALGTTADHVWSDVNAAIDSALDTIASC